MFKKIFKKCLLTTVFINMGWVPNGNDSWVWQDKTPIEESIEYIPSDDILEYIKNAEGWHQGWKDDGKGNLTTGWGIKATNALRKQYPKGMTREQADKYFKEVAIPEKVDSLKKVTPNFDKLNQNQRDALLSAIYNVGEGKFSTGSPKLQQALEDLNFDEIVKQMDWGYNDRKFSGLRKRRDYERKLFLTPVQEDIDKDYNKWFKPVQIPNFFQLYSK